MRSDYMGRIGILLIAFFVLLVVISTVISTVNKAKGSGNPAFLGINSSGWTGAGRFKWMALGVIMFIFIAAMAYFVFFIGGKKYTRY